MDEQRYCVTFPEDAVSISVTAGITVLAAAIAAGLKPDAPCGGRGTCGKCLVRITAGRDHLTMAGGPVPGDELLPACQLMVAATCPPSSPVTGKTAFSPAASPWPIPPLPRAASFSPWRPSM